MWAGPILRARLPLPPPTLRDAFGCSSAAVQRQIILWFSTCLRPNTSNAWCLKWNDRALLLNGFQIHRLGQNASGQPQHLADDFRRHWTGEEKSLSEFAAQLPQ